MANDRIFCRVSPTGIVWADREQLVDGDYARLAFLPFDTLELAIEARCTPELAREIQASAAIVQSRKGQPYQVSTSGQTITLGKGR